MNFETLVIFKPEFAWFTREGGAQCLVFVRSVAAVIVSIAEPCM